MVDKASFNRVDADYDLPMPDHALPNRLGVESLTDAELLLALPIVYGRTNCGVSRGHQFGHC